MASICLVVFSVTAVWNTGETGDINTKLVQSSDPLCIFFLCDPYFSFHIFFFSTQEQDSPRLNLYYLSLWLALSQSKILLVEKIVIVELGKSRPSMLTICVLFWLWFWEFLGLFYNRWLWNSPTSFIPRNISS